MVIIERREGERIFLGRGITITVLGRNGDQVRVGIEAPPTVQISRADLGFESHLAKQVRRESRAMDSATEKERPS